VDIPSGAHFDPGVAQHWEHSFIAEKSEEANLLKRSGGPRRTRTSNPLITSSSGASEAKEGKAFSPAKQRKVRQNLQPGRNRKSGEESA
jgi:hypothetical protein